ncbi:RNA polymerase sigma factor [Kordiimonas aquimaris]|uniref:RNA polymerase sigma factor n=1 Tax=Kordiimonas aquimaris TaxID=707591 RepID=UPI0021CF9819|nr:RNA polymerase sigma factor [Kordiimonas aquimaris]
MADLLENFLRNEVALKKYLRRFFSKQQDIEDAVQETFLKTFAASTKSEIQNPKSFLFRVAKNTALNELAKKTNTTTEYFEDSQNSHVLIDSEQLSAEDQLDGRRKLFVFSQAVAQLSPNCRKVLILRKIEGLKVKEIARHLDMSVSGVEKHIAGGLVQCSQFFRERGYDPAEFGGRIKKTGNDANTAISNLLRANDE